MNRFLLLCFTCVLFLSIVVLNQISTKLNSENHIEDSNLETMDTIALQEGSTSILAGCKNLFGPFTPMKTGQNYDSGNIINYSWKVHHTKRGTSSNNCETRECLCESDLFRIIGPEKPNPNTDPEPPLDLVIVSQADAAIYHFPSIKSKLHGSPQLIDSVEMTFIDDVSGTDECRKLIVNAVRSNNDSRRTSCDTYLENNAYALDDVERAEACSHSDLVHWEVIDLSSKDCIAISSHEEWGNKPSGAIVSGAVPEPGQGTASGTQ